MRDYHIKDLSGLIEALLANGLDRLVVKRFTVQLS